MDSPACLKPCTYPHLYSKKLFKFAFIPLLCGEKKDCNVDTWLQDTRRKGVVALHFLFREIEKSSHLTKEYSYQ